MEIDSRLPRTIFPNYRYVSFRCYGEHITTQSYVAHTRHDSFADN